MKKAEHSENEKGPNIDKICNVGRFLLADNYEIDHTVAKLKYEKGQIKNSYREKT